MNTPIAVVASLCSAGGYAASSVIQHRTARSTPSGTGLRLGLLGDLARRPAWLIGLCLAAAAFAAHAVALSLGELAVVQPLLIAGLLFALPASVLLDRHRPSLTEWSWALMLVISLALFLTAANPTAGSVPSDTDRLGLIVAIGTVLAAAVALLANQLDRDHSATAFGTAAGLTYGLTAALIKQVSQTASHDPFKLLTSWPAYALIAIGACALVLNQAAYQAGPLAASLPPMTMVDPVVAVIIGVLVFDEHLAHTAPAILLETLSAAAVLLATIQVANHASKPSTRYRPPIEAGQQPPQRRSP
ncbi:MAG: DMT family transporter [Actinomycetota bacterium]|nr:DMT family transporter [Actinomycetota bacterium]